MARRGRPKKQNVVRFPSGEIKEEILEPPFNMEGIAETEVAHEGKLLHLKRRIPWLERLYDEGRIRKEQQIAGEKYAWLVYRFRQMLGAPAPEPKVANHDGRVRGKAPKDFDLLTPEERDQLKEDNDALTRQYDGAWLILVDRHNGVEMKRAVDSLCLRDELTDMDLARKGLFLLAEYFGLETRKRA